MDPQSCYPSEGQGQTIKGKHKRVMAGEEEGKTRPRAGLEAGVGWLPPAPAGTY